MADNRPLVSIITRTMAGRGESLRKAGASVLAQDYPNIEWVLVIDGPLPSGDPLDGIRQDGANLIVLPLGYRAGRSRAGNLALEASGGEYLGFLDDDDLLLPNHVSLLVQALEGNPESPAAYADSLQANIEVLSEKPLRFKEASRRACPSVDYNCADLWTNNIVPIQAVLFRRGIYQQWGGFCEDLEFMEDWHLWLRYSLSGPFVHVKETTSVFRVPADENILKQRRKLHLRGLPDLRRRQKQLLRAARRKGQLNSELPSPWSIQLRSWQESVYRLLFG